MAGVRAQLGLKVRRHVENNVRWKDRWKNRWKDELGRWPCRLRMGWCTVIVQKERALEWWHWNSNVTLEVEVIELRWI